MAMPTAREKLAFETAQIARIGARRCCAAFLCEVKRNLFHELPPHVRRAGVAEINRMLKPGGTLIFVDSLRAGDPPDQGGL